MKCNIPSFVSDHVEIIEWVDSNGSHYTRDEDNSGKFKAKLKILVSSCLCKALFSKMWYSLWRRYISILFIFHFPFTKKKKWKKFVYFVLRSRTIELVVVEPNEREKISCIFSHFIMTYDIWVSAFSTLQRATQWTVLIWQCYRNIKFSNNIASFCFKDSSDAFMCSFFVCLLVEPQKFNWNVILD